MMKFLKVLATLLLLPSAALAQSAPKKYLSAASTNSTLVWTGKALVRSVVAINTTATIYYLKLYNKPTAPTCGTDIPDQTYPVPASATGAGLVVSAPVGMLFGTGFGFCLTGAIADNDTSSAATGVAVNFGVSGN